MRSTYLGIILHPSPILKGIKGELDCHHAIVQVVAVVDSALDADVVKLVFVKLLQLLQHLTAMLLFGFGSDCPMLRCIKCI
jgi:hypothetical protein